MKKVLLSSAVALAAFSAATAVSANEATTVTEANPEALPTLVTPKAAPETKVEKTTEPDADSAAIFAAAKAEADAKAAEKKANEELHKAAAAKLADTNKDFDLNALRDYVRTMPAKEEEKPAEAKVLKVLDQFGKELKFDGKNVEVKAEKDGETTVEVQTKRGTYKLTVEIRANKAKLVKAPQLVANAAAVQKDGWVKQENGKWQFIQKGEAVKSGWAKVDGKWYLFDQNGDMLTGWQFVDGKWYFLNNSGDMATGWVKDNGTWYYLNGSGAMVTGWLNDNGTWYYLNSNGSMKASTWFELNGKWYYVNGSGALAVNTTVGGYTVNGNGEWVK